MPVIEPPKTPPQYTPIMSSSAGTIPMRYVKGSTSTIAFSIVIPGKAPATMPMVSPSRIMAKLSGASALTKPAPRFAKISNIVPQKSRSAR